MKNNYKLEIGKLYKFDKYSNYILKTPPIVIIIFLKIFQKKYLFCYIWKIIKINV